MALVLALVLVLVVVAGEEGFLLIRSSVVLK